MVLKFVQCEGLHFGDSLQRCFPFRTFLGTNLSIVGMVNIQKSVSFAILQNLDFNDALIDRKVRDQMIHFDSLLLANTIRPANKLVILGRRPLGILQQPWILTPSEHFRHISSIRCHS